MRLYPPWYFNCWKLLRKTDLLVIRPKSSINSSWKGLSFSKFIFSITFLIHGPNCIKNTYRAFINNNQTRLICFFFLTQKSTNIYFPTRKSKKLWFPTSISLNPPMFIWPNNLKTMWLSMKEKKKYNLLLNKPNSTFRINSNNIITSEES